jgi:hypothetical protein
VHADARRKVHWSCLAVLSALCLWIAGVDPLRASAAEPQGLPDRGPSPRLTLTWSTASELDVYGFVVMRADAAMGPFLPLSDELLPGAGNSDLMHHYRFDDTRVELGKTYYYAVDSVSLSGERRRHSPVVWKRCCEATAAEPNRSPNGHQRGEGTDPHTSAERGVDDGSAAPPPAAGPQKHQGPRGQDAPCQKERP